MLTDGITTLRNYVESRSVGNEIRTWRELVELIAVRFGISPGNRLSMVTLR